MRHLIRRLIPDRMVSLVIKLYWLMFGHSGLFPKVSPGLKCLISYNKYGGYCVPESSRDRPAARKILLNEVYEPETIEYIRGNCQGGIVHAGTYFGDFLPALSQCAEKVWAFEPNPENYRCAKITLELNDLKNVVLTHAGLGAKKENLFIKTEENGQALGGASEIVDKAGEGIESVQIVTIDESVGESHISIIQLDVEGHEKEALSGALETIQRCRPIIILEVLPNSTLLESNWFAEHILSLGYREINNLHGNLVFKVTKSGQMHRIIRHLMSNPGYVGQ